jgi:hypothetical protein
VWHIKYRNVSIEFCQKSWALSFGKKKKEKKRKKERERERANQKLECAAYSHKHW